MTILARTADYLAEFEAGFLSISRYSDGYCKAWKRLGLSGEFRACLEIDTQERVIEVYLRLMRKAPWEPLYKPHCMPGADPEWDAATGSDEVLAQLDAAAAKREIRHSTRREVA